MTNYDPPGSSEAGFAFGATPIPFSPIRFRRYAAELSHAVYELSRERQMHDYGFSSTPVPFPRKSSQPRPVPAPQQRQSVMAETPTPLPSVDIAKTDVSKKPAPSSFSASIRAIMDEARADLVKAREDGLSKVKDAVGKLTEAKSAVVQVTGVMAKTIEDEAASVMADIGQISNMGPE